MTSFARSRKNHPKIVLLKASCHGRTSVPVILLMQERIFLRSFHCIIFEEEHFTYTAGRFQKDGESLSKE